MAGIKTDDGRARRVKVFEAVVAAWAANGYPPTTKHLTEVTGMPYTTMLWHLQSLRDQGVLLYEDGQIGRTLRVAKRKKVEDIQ